MSVASKSPISRVSALLIRTLVWFGPLTRSKLSELIGSTRGQTNRLLEDLHARGWIVFGEELHSPVGRPAARVFLSPSLGYFLSVTLEDDKGRITLATSDMVSVATKTFEYNFATGPTILLTALERQIRSLLAENQVTPKKLLTMAVSVPGPVETREQSVFRPHPSPGWQGFDIAAYLESSDLSKCFLTGVPRAHSDHATVYCSIGFQPVSAFATGNTLEIMGVGARLATTQTSIHQG